MPTWRHLRSALGVVNEPRLVDAGLGLRDLRGVHARSRRLRSMRLVSRRVLDGRDRDELLDHRALAGLASRGRCRTAARGYCLLVLACAGPSERSVHPDAPVVIGHRCASLPPRMEMDHRPDHRQSTRVLATRHRDQEGGESENAPRGAASDMTAGKSSMMCVSAR